jgi:hypothetical protein
MTIRAQGYQCNCDAAAPVPAGEQSTAVVHGQALRRRLFNDQKHSVDAVRALNCATFREASLQHWLTYLACVRLSPDCWQIARIGR